MPLLHHADMPAIDFDALEAAKPEGGDREVEQHRFIQVGHQRVRHRVDWSERRDVVCPMPLLVRLIAMKHPFVKKAGVTGLPALAGLGILPHLVLPALWQYSNGLGRKGER
jgi:hypothetical protein